MIILCLLESVVSILSALGLTFALSLSTITLYRKVNICKVIKSNERCVGATLGSLSGSCFAVVAYRGVVWHMQMIYTMLMICRFVYENLYAILLLLGYEMNYATLRRIQGPVRQNRCSTCSWSPTKIDIYASQTVRERWNRTCGAALLYIICRFSHLKSIVSMRACARAIFLRNVNYL